MGGIYPPGVGNLLYQADWRYLWMLHLIYLVHTAQAEGSLWRALGVLTAAGALRVAVTLLRKKHMPDCAAAYAEAATSAGFGSQSAASDTGKLL